VAKNAIPVTDLFHVSPRPRLSSNDSSGLEGISRKPEKGPDIERLARNTNDVTNLDIAANTNSNPFSRSTEARFFRAFFV
jgi:hypothetical protein